MNESFKMRRVKAEAPAVVRESLSDRDAVLQHLETELTLRMEEGMSYTVTRVDGTLSCTAGADSFSSLLTNIKALLAEENEKAHGPHFVAVLGGGMHHVDIRPSTT